MGRKTALDQLAAECDKNKASPGAGRAWWHGGMTAGTEWGQWGPSK